MKNVSNLSTTTWSSVTYNESSQTTKTPTSDSVVSSSHRNTLIERLSTLSERGGGRSQTSATTSGQPTTSCTNMALVESLVATQAPRHTRGSSGSSSDQSHVSSAFSRAPKAPRWSVQEYLQANMDRPKTLVVGCGTTPESVLMGKMHGTQCSRGLNHERDFTVDISKDAGADLVMDFVLFSGSDLRNHGARQFDTVEFEYLNRGPRDRFTSTHVDMWINGADTLLKDSGTATFYSHHAPYLQYARQAMEKRGYTVTDHSVPANGTPTNRHGHRYCTGVKPASSSWLSWKRG